MLQIDEHTVEPTACPPHPMISLQMQLPLFGSSHHTLCVVGTGAGGESSKWIMLVHPFPFLLLQGITEEASDQRVYYQTAHNVFQGDLFASFVTVANPKKQFQLRIKTGKGDPRAILSNMEEGWAKKNQIDNYSSEGNGTLTHDSKGEGGSIPGFSA